MEIGLAVGGAFLSSALNVLFDRLAPSSDLLKMFKSDTGNVRLLKKLRMTLLGLQAVLSDAENKQASNPYVSQWLNELQDAVHSAENLVEEVNYEVLRLKVEGQHQNLWRNKQQREKRESSTSVVVESEIFGRQNEIEELVGRLTSHDAKSRKLTVIPIVGMAGIGKTTFAKAIYNDESVKTHFDFKAWICVSEPYDALRITKELLQEFGLMVDNNLNQLQVKLKESLKKKKFLIVLDDVWNDNYKEWDDLRNLFLQGDVGSMIIVTTRKESVASMMDEEKISMDILSSEVSWSLFRRHAFETIDPKKRILRSEIWELPNNDILAALSYNDIPAHLKRCFSVQYFPKIIHFRKNKSFNCGMLMV
ncbi:hypothetical protein KY284_008658 [Solanum tuberosum]|nr:hypothetical protein KY284_008658 [Solanum tuberosum]